ncbi:MAG: SDR family NAD(P)-dependent oxidoreductase [Ignavibacteria bacterium]|nr:SDR family NAD(P)-dependent oxidoreductase [Ignavibacteria bacterium]
MFTDFSRSNEIESHNFEHFEIDLKDLNKVKFFDFPEFKNPKSLVLVNNSASASEIVHLGRRTSDNIIENYNVNIVSPSLLMNNFLMKYQSVNCKKIIMNISSGAAYRPIESWSTYCATKAALAMISEVTDVEQKLKHPENPVHIFSVGPGVVDTQMQTHIRGVSPDDFSMVGQFIEFHEKNELAKPADVAKKLLYIIKNPGKFEKVALSVKDI